MKRYRVLVLAEQANPDWVSVPLVGWNQITALSRYVDIHLVTHIRNKEAIDRSWLPPHSVTYVEPRKIQKIFDSVVSVLVSKKGGWTTYTGLKVPLYYAFERLAWQIHASDLISGKFDLIHRITPVSPAIPSPISVKCHKYGIPFVIGPINGGLKWPKGFKYALAREGEWFSVLRGLKDYLPFSEQTKKNAAAIIVGSRTTWNEIPEKYHSKIFYLPENGINPDHYQLQVNYDQKLPVKIAFVGRLVPLKAVDLVIQAVTPLIRKKQIEFHIFGDGPERNNLENLTKKLDIASGIIFHGWVAHGKLQEELVKCQIFAFPSIREFGGGAVMEAMALGLVPIVTNYGGIAELVTPETGFQIKLTTPQHIVEQLNQVLEYLINNSNMIEVLGKKARDRIFSKFTWDHKAKMKLEIYDWVMEQQHKPVHLVPPEESNEVEWMTRKIS